MISLESTIVQHCMRVCGIWDGVQDQNNEDISPQIAAMQKHLKDALIHGMVWSLEGSDNAHVALTL
jgi:hypothetical protein